MRQKYSSIKLDLSKITKMDTAGYQLLFSAGREAEKNEKVLELINHGSEAARIFDLYGELYGSLEEVSGDR